MGMLRALLSVWHGAARSVIHIVVHTASLKCVNNKPKIIITHTFVDVKIAEDRIDAVVNENLSYQKAPLIITKQFLGDAVIGASTWD